MSPFAPSNRRLLFWKRTLQRTEHDRQLCGLISVITALVGQSQKLPSVHSNSLLPIWGG